jgi:uncharacterized OB-fold protein
VSDPPFRVLPRLTDDNRDFWTAGARGELRFWRCQDCGYWLHPPQPLCPRCHSKNLATEPVSGKATLASFTINHQAWMPGPELPFVVGIVEIDDVEVTGGQGVVRLTTNIVNCPHDELRVGMAMRVTFEHHPDPDGDVYLPLFEPDA